MLLLGVTLKTKKRKKGNKERGETGRRGKERSLERKGHKAGRGFSDRRRALWARGGAWQVACFGIGCGGRWVEPNSVGVGGAGMSSGQENGKVWSVASTVRFRVDRKDDGGIVICEAQNQALPSGHSKQTQYVLDVQCKCPEGWALVVPKAPQNSRSPTPLMGKNHCCPSCLPIDSPTARIHASQAVAREGDTLVLTCAVTGNPR